MSSTNACLKCGKPFTHTLESIQHYCMSDADKGPREFELYFFYGDVKVISKNEVFILHEEKIHVVEHSAYDDLANMYAVLLNAHTKLQKELDAARAEIELLRKGQQSPTPEGEKEDE